MTTPDETQDAPEPDAPEPDAPTPPDLLPDEEEAEEDAQAAPETEPDESEPPAPQGPSDREREAMFVKAEKAATAYARKIGDIFGDQAVDLTPCPLCPDIHKGFVNVYDAGRIPPDVSEATMLFLGFAQKASYAASPWVNQCATCNGYGKVTTGSLVPGNDEAVCRECRGFGYVPPPSEVGPAATNGELLHLPAGEHVAPLSQDERDPAGEPKILPDGRENPNYMKWPQGKILVPPWGVTAGLTAQDAVTA